MPKRCIVWNCSNVADKTQNIAIHVIPFYVNDRPIAKSRKKQWVDFVREKRGEKWIPSGHSVICSRQKIIAEIRLRRTSGKVPSNKRRNWGFSCPSIDGRNGNRRRWKYAHRTCKAKGLYRNLSSRVVYIHPQNVYISFSFSSLKALLLF